MPGPDRSRPARPAHATRTGPAFRFHFISFILYLTNHPCLVFVLSVYLDIPLVPPGRRPTLDRPGLPRDHPGHTTGRLGPSQTHPGRTADHSPPLAATRMTHYHRCNPSRRPITITPSFATPGTCYHGHHSSILSSAQVLCGLLIPSLSITPWRIIH